MMLLHLVLKSQQMSLFRQIGKANMKAYLILGMPHQLRQFAKA
jgi:hypothetical protein